MSRLPIPPENDELEEIFVVCIGNCREAKKTRLEPCLPLLKTDAENYKRLIPDHIDQFKSSPLPQDVSANDLVSIYKQKFVPKDEEGRKYYDAIMKQAKRGVCPICGVRTAKTLEHYLPKKQMPTLAVTPINLIPSCRDCNMDKNDDMVLRPEETPAHIYLDEIDDKPWLFAVIDTDLAVSFEVRCPEDWKLGVQERVKRHLDHYNLHVLYSSHADMEIANKKRSWRRIWERGGEAELREHITDLREGAEEEELNSWYSALYRGIEERFHVLISFLEQNARPNPSGL